MKPMPMFPIAPPPRDDVDQAAIALQVEAIPREVELDAIIRAQSSAPQVIQRLTTLEDCLWAAVEALAKLPPQIREVLAADAIIDRAKFLLRGDLELPDRNQCETPEHSGEAEENTTEEGVSPEQVAHSALTHAQYVRSSVRY